MGLKAKSDLSQRKRNLTFATDKSLCYWYCGTWSCRNGQKRSTRRPEGGEEPAVLSILHSQIVLIRQFRRAVTVWFFICSFVIRVSAEIASGELQLASRGGRPSGGGGGGVDALNWQQLKAKNERTNERKQQDMSAARFSGQRESSLTGENFHQFYTIHLTRKAKGFPYRHGAGPMQAVWHKGDNEAESDANPFAVIDIVKRYVGYKELF